MPTATARALAAYEADISAELAAARDAYHAAREAASAAVFAAREAAHAADFAEIHNHHMAPSLRWDANVAYDAMMDADCDFLRATAIFDAALDAANRNEAQP
jgi:hypothetical protein